MNERIEKLLKQATIKDHWSIDEGRYLTNYLNEQKFAELIVRQCMALCEDVTERNDPAIACYYEIKQHFLGEEL